MPLKKLRRVTRRILIAINVAAIVLLLVVGFADRLDPIAHPLLANLGLAMPLALLVNVGFLLFWLLVSPRYALIPVAGLLISYVPVRAYCPINIPQTPPDDALKVMTFNVQRLDSVDRDLETGDVTAVRAVRYITQSQADIVCLQELWPGDEKNAELQKAYPYIESVRRRPSGQVLAVLSRYPILHKKLIRFSEADDGAGAFWLDVNGDTIVVVNCHLLSNGLAMNERRQVDSLLQGQNNITGANSHSRNLLHKLVDSSVQRAPQADSIAHFVGRVMRKYSVIVCGDFNSCPNAYPRTRLARRLTDCFESAGNGISWSYNQNHIYVRIDHMLCTNDFEPYHFVVDDKIAASDHYPLIGWLKKKVK